MKFDLSIVAILLASTPINARAVRNKKREPNCPESLSAVEFHRFFDNDNEHYLYTTISAEKSYALKDGYDFDGVIGRAFETHEPSTVPFYHIFNDDTQANFYTTNKEERDSVLSNDSANVDMDVAAYIFTKRVCGSKPLFRLFNPTTGDYFFTTDEDEKDYAVSDRGYDAPIVSGFVLAQ